MDFAFFAIFVVGYAFIAFEHTTHINKAAPAMLTGVALWTGVAIVGSDHGNTHLMEHTGDIAQILFFLLGAMSIVELVDAHGGFGLVTRYVRAPTLRKLSVTVGVTTFFLSSVLDNLTTTIVMVSLLRRMVHDKDKRWPMVAIVVVAANAGGAWSPIGDLTTTMLWMDGRITTWGIVGATIIPAIVALAVPLALLVRATPAGQGVEAPLAHDGVPIPRLQRIVILLVGVGALLSVPVFKTLTHLPPYLGMLMGLGVVWATTEVLHRFQPEAPSKELQVAEILRRVDVPSVMFFLGILLSVAALQTVGALTRVAGLLSDALPNIYMANTAIGLLSSIVDNVPLVAAAIDMYPLAATGPYAVDGRFWNGLALAAGTGGSCLIIGSAAGVAAMGLEGIPFGWYLRRVTLPAIIGLLAAMAVLAL